MVSTGVLWIVEMPARTEDNLARTNEVKLGEALLRWLVAYLLTVGHLRVHKKPQWAESKEEGKTKECF